MKKLTAAIAALALYYSASAFGPNPDNETTFFNSSGAKAVKVEKVGEVISSAFNEKFATATEVSWKENQGLYFGYFKMGEQNLIAAYTTGGELFATSRQLDVKELPQAVSEKLSRNYSDCSIAPNVTEIDMEGETAYYVTVESKNSSRLLKFLPGGSVELVKKIKKKELKGSVS
ncbi:MAG: hypothetical protein H7Y86_00995 [Rhizobacter sp.]|nr:hypothetical protein [Ferruginibacter sp.]